MRICRRIRLIAAFVLVSSATVAMAAVTMPPSGSELPRRIVVTNSASWVPYSFLDQAGQPRGVLIEFWRLFARKNNVEVEFKLVDWAKSLEMVRNGEADVHGGLTETDQRRESLYFYQREILRVRTVVFFDEEVGTRDLASMSDMTVGVIAETAEEEFLRSNFPNILLKRYPNSYTLIKSAVDGEIPAFISDYPTGYYHLVLQHNLDRFQTGPTLYTRPLRIATRLSDAAKLDRIGISITEIPHAEVLRVLNKWLIPEAELPPWFWPTVIVGLLTLVLAGIGVYLFALRRVLDIKTRELRASLQELRAANLELDRLARLDSLTELPNRFDFFQIALSELERAKRYRRALSLIMIDLDHFKAINDQYGHQTGDAVLKQIATVGQMHLRPSDIFARLGGEEFVILAPETGSPMAVRLIERILDYFITTPVSYEDKQISVTFSAGIAEYSEGDTLDTLIASADAALYRSKTLGRARVSTASADARKIGPEVSDTPAAGPILLN